MLDKAAQILGYRFRNEKLLAEALRHSSTADRRVESNERMEFLGDAIMGYIVCEYLFLHYPDLLEGDLTKIKSAVVSRRTCALISESKNLVSMLTLGKGMSGRSELPASITSAVLEAIIAAIYLDGGIEPAREFVLGVMIPYIEDNAQSTHQHNFKSVLQQHAQRELAAAPVYALLDEKGPDHSKAFEVAVLIGDRRFPAAWANSKKEAEQRAALLALNELGVAEIDEDGRVTLRQPPAKPTGDSNATPVND